MKYLKSSDQSLNHLALCVHGDSGIGKTTSLRTLPEASTLILCPERGVVPLRNHNYHVSPLNSWDDVREAVRTFSNGKPVEVEKGKPIKILVFDSLTECNELAKRQILEDRKGKTKERTGGEREIPKGIYDEQFTIEDWGLLGIRMGRFVSAVARLPVHTLFTALSDYRENKKTGETKKVPALNGRMSFECPAQFDVMVHMEVATDSEGKSIRLWRCQPSENIVAKDASGALAEFEPTNWSKLITKILKKKGAKS